MIVKLGATYHIENVCSHQKVYWIRFEKIGVAATAAVVVQEDQSNLLIQHPQYILRKDLRKIPFNWLL